MTWKDVFNAVASISGITVQSGREAASRALGVYLDGLRVAGQARERQPGRVLAKPVPGDAGGQPF